jgi:hypothetical protein
MLRSRIRAAAARPWSLQYSSGLYADHNWRAAWSALVPGAAPALALLGNCGSAASPEKAANTFEFLRRCSNTWERVFWVFGPHEYSSDSGAVFTTQRDTLQRVVQEAAGENANIVILDQDDYEIPGENVVLLGATAWTDGLMLKKMPKGSIERTHLWAFEDGRKKTFDAERIKGWHEDDMDWVRGSTDAWRLRRPEVRQILLTHSLCSGALLGRGRIPYETCQRAILDLMSGWTTERPMKNPSVSAWLCGAGAGSVSGMLRAIGGGPHRVFCAANTCWASPGGWRNPNYLPDRRLEVAVPGKLK